jgi:hypothetical protein
MSLQLPGPSPIASEALERVAALYAVEKTFAVVTLTSVEQPGNREAASWSTCSLALGT